MNNTSSSARASFTNCKGENLGYWVFQHSPGDSQMYVTIDQNTIDSCITSDFFHRCIDSMKSGNEYSSSQLSNYSENLSQGFKSLSGSTQRLILSRQNDSWDRIRLYAMGELNRKLRELDLSGSEYKQSVNECIDYYALLASAPVSGVFNNEGEALIFLLCKDVLKNIVSDKNLIFPVLYSFFASMELAPLGRTASRIS